MGGEMFLPGNGEDRNAPEKASGARVGKQFTEEEVRVLSGCGLLLGKAWSRGRVEEIAAKMELRVFGAPPEEKKLGKSEVRGKKACEEKVDFKEQRRRGLLCYG